MVTVAVVFKDVPGLFTAQVPNHSAEERTAKLSKVEGVRYAAVIEERESLTVKDMYWDGRKI